MILNKISLHSVLKNLKHHIDKTREIEFDSDSPIDMLLSFHLIKLNASVVSKLKKLEIEIYEILSESNAEIIEGLGSFKDIEIFKNYYGEKKEIDENETV